MLKERSGRLVEGGRTCQFGSEFDLIRAELAAEDLRVVFDLRPRDFLDDLEQIELARGIFVTAHDQDFLKALVVGRAVFGRAVAHSVELEPFERPDDLRRIESAGAFDGVRIEQRLDVARMRCL